MTITRTERTVSSATLRTVDAKTTPNTPLIALHRQHYGTLSTLDREKQTKIGRDVDTC